MISVVDDRQQDVQDFDSSDQIAVQHTLQKPPNIMQLVDAKAKI